jgi:hypothetical protein
VAELGPRAAAAAACSSRRGVRRAWVNRFSTPHPSPHPSSPPRPFETMLAELKRLKQEYPDRVLIASIMEEINK